MDILTKIVNIQGFNVVHAEIQETTVYLSLEGQSDSAICPQCGMASQRVRVWYPRCVRDVPLSGKTCYLRFETRYFGCLHCHTTFAEFLEFVEAKRDYTTRYEA